MCGPVAERIEPVGTESDCGLFHSSTHNMTNPTKAGLGASTPSSIAWSASAAISAGCLAPAGWLAAGQSGGGVGSPPPNQGGEKTQQNNSKFAM